MENIVLLFLCLALGVGLRLLNRMPENAHVGLNAFIINISLPVPTLLQIHGAKLHPSLAFAVFVPWLVFAIGALIFAVGGR